MINKVVDQFKEVPLSYRVEIWKKALNMVPSEDHMIDVFSRGVLHESTSYVEHVHKKLNLWTTEKDEGASLILREQVWDIYKIRERTLNDEKLVIDVGSNIGSFTIVTFQNFPTVKILSVEAVPFTYIFQMVNIFSHIPACVVLSGQVRVELVAITDKDDQTRTIEFRDDSLMTARNYLYTYKPKVYCNVTLPTITIMTLLERLGYDKLPVFVMKIDCEGCEFDLVPNLTEKYYEKIPFICGEYHINDMRQYSPDRLPSAEIINITKTRLRKSGFRVDHLVD